MQDRFERRRLKKIAFDMKKHGLGIIIRTVAEGKTDQQIQNDYASLEKKYNGLMKLAEKSEAPALVHNDLEMTSSVLRDLISDKVEKIVVDSKDDYKKIQKIFSEFEPEIVFHLAAQPCVLASYDNPLQTFSSNIMGSVNILEASRHTNSVKAVIMVTTDKVYKNNEWIYGYRETDTIGGHDPYSSSKACMELVTESYRKSYSESSNNELLIASARAGNVIGGGDWTENRIITDVIKAATKGEKVLLRNPKSSRPWQHVLESLSGYLLLGQKLHTNNLYAADSWNFGPAIESNLNVEELIYLMGEKWEKISWKNVVNANLGYESKALMVDSSKANNLLGWRPVWDIEKTIHHTIEWYRKYLEENRVITEEQIENYITDAKENNCIWAM